MRAVLAVLLGLTMLVAPAAASASAATTAPLTNLAHLDFLTTSVLPPQQARHTTFRLAQQPRIGALWVYATHNDDGSYTRVGGGDLDAATNTYTQGAYDADDIARAAVVYLRHWRQFGDAHSRDAAYQLLRGLTYLQTASGPNAGNVVLWMQPDGTLHPSALPKETPDPSDSGNSYWLARTVWALGEGYQAFVRADPAFARFLRARIDLAVGALDRDSLSRYGKHQRVDGARTPAWLIVDGADASAEAVLGLAAFVRAGGHEGRRPLRQLTSGIAALGSRPGRTWPYGAMLPSATSLSTWHAWASLMPAALARASSVLGDSRLARPAVADAAGFSPDLLTSYGPINGLAPAPTDQAQIAYGADSRVQSALAVARLTGSAGLRELAGVFAGWYFGQNPAGTPMYNRATGVTYDGVSADGVVNENSGAESTIHGLLSMLALDAAPRVARIALDSGHVVARTGTVTVEGESATVTGAGSVVVADPASTAESTWSNGQYLQVAGPTTARWTIRPSSRPRVLEAVIDRVPGRAGTAQFDVGRVVRFGGGGAQGASAAPGRLVPVVVGTVPAGATSLTAGFRGGAGRLDALLLTPEVTVLRTAHTAVLSSRAAATRVVRVPVDAPVTVRSYDASGRIVGRHPSRGGSVSVRVVPDGFSTVLPASG